MIKSDENFESIAKLLNAVFDILSIESGARNQMERDVGEILALEIVNQLFENLSESEQVQLKHLLAGKTEEEQREILERYLGEHCPRETRLQVVEAASQKVISDYIMTLFESANDSQQQEIKLLIERHQSKAQ